MLNLTSKLLFYQPINTSLFVKYLLTQKLTRDKKIIQRYWRYSISVPFFIPITFGFENGHGICVIFKVRFIGWKGNFSTILLLFQTFEILKIKSKIRHAMSKLYGLLLLGHTYNRRW